MRVGKGQKSGWRLKLRGQATLRHESEVSNTAEETGPGSDTVILTCLFSNLLSQKEEGGLYLTASPGTRPVKSKLSSLIHDNSN